ncbi:LppP/LprE family lipoprotein [Rothia mucilaginosa]|uniref:LppP/LprE family lipoprotein n=1 Tax=Rothia mucilaginosa TaxID=43675 RepID=UPI0026F1E234|nr:LppP/LprE family lipoprotein [Rothia mucilaginosa]
MSSTRRRFTGRPSLALPALGAALALVVTSCSASTDSAVSGTVVSSSGSASASASATSTQELFPTPSASPSASASASPSASSPAPVPSVVTITVHAEPTASESKSDSKSEAKSESKKDSTCASDSASTVVSKALRELKNKSKWDQWTNVSRTYEGYDPCAELSWIDAIPGSSPSDCCISSMAHHILLFHRGKFIGTATYEPYSFSPVITRTSDSSISVTYRYMKEDEKVHNASGRTTAEFSWSSSQNKVVMTGEVPPSY